MHAWYFSRGRYCTNVFIDYEFDHALVDLFEWSWLIECMCKLFTEHGGVSREEGESFDSKCFVGKLCDDMGESKEML